MRLLVYDDDAFLGWGSTTQEHMRQPTVQSDGAMRTLVHDPDVVLRCMRVFFKTSNDAKSDNIIPGFVPDKLFR